MSSIVVNTQVESYFVSLIGECFRNKCKSIENMYISLYEFLWKYYIGYIPQGHTYPIPIASIRKIDVAISTNGNGVVVGIIVDSNDNQYIKIPIDVTNKVYSAILTMFDGCISFGGHKTKEYYLTNSLQSEKLEYQLEDKWNTYISEFILQIDGCATNPKLDGSVYKEFCNFYYLSIVININLFVISVLYDINNSNKHVDFTNQFNKYALIYDNDKCKFKLTIANRSGRFVAIDLLVPLGIQEYIDLVKNNLNNLLDAVFSFYNDSDSVIPDKTLQAMGDSVFALGRHSLKEFDQVSYYTTGVPNNTLGEIFKSVKMSKDESKEEKPIIDIEKTDTVVESISNIGHFGVDEQYSKNVHALLSGRITEYQIFTSRLSLSCYCYNALKTLYEVSTYATFIYSVRVYKRLSRDKFHTVTITAFNSSGILVNFSTKIFLGYEDSHKRKGVILEIVGDSKNCTQFLAPLIAEESNSDILDDRISSMISQSNWFVERRKDYTSIQSFKFKNEFKKSGFKLIVDQLLSKNSAYRFTVWGIFELGNAVYVLIDVWLRVDLQKTILVTNNENGIFIYSID